jgi:hypothetical protein
MGIEYLIWSNRLHFIEINDPISPLASPSSLRQQSQQQSQQQQMLNEDESQVPSAIENERGFDNQFVMMSIRTIVPVKTMKRDLVKQSSLGLQSNGIFAESLSELQILQHLAYLSKPTISSSSCSSSALKRSSGAMKFFLEPLGQVHLHREGSENAEENDGEEEEDEDEDFNPDGQDEDEEGTAAITTESSAGRLDSTSSAASFDPFGMSFQQSDAMDIDTSSAGLLPLPQSRATSTAQKSEKSEKSARAKKSSSSSSSVKLPLVKCLLFAPVHISLSALFDRKFLQSSSGDQSNPTGGLVVPSFLILQWVQELVLAVDYLSSW